MQICAFLHAILTRKNTQKRTKKCQNAQKCAKTRHFGQTHATPPSIIPPLACTQFLPVFTPIWWSTCQAAGCKTSGTDFPAAIFLLASAQNLCRDGTNMSGWPRFGSVCLRFGDGTVRAVPVFGSRGSSIGRGFLCVSGQCNREGGSGSGFGSRRTVPVVPVPHSVPGKTVPTVPVSVPVRFLNHPVFREEKSIHHHRGDPPFFLFPGLRRYGVYPSFRTYGVYPCPLFSQENGIHHSFFCSVTSGSGDRRRKEGSHGGGVYSFFP